MLVAVSNPVLEVAGVTMREAAVAVLACAPVVKTVAMNPFGSARTLTWRDEVAFIFQTETALFFCVF